jgi:hypothetical protein
MDFSTTGLTATGFARVYCNYFWQPQVSNVKYSIASVSQPVAPLLNTQPITLPRVTTTYADVTRGGNDNNQDITLSKFLEEFKRMFNQLTQQNSLVINTITTLISKIK